MYRLLLLIFVFGFSHALYGGKEIGIEEAPFIVRIRERNHHKCGGVILNEQWILTLSACINPYIENYRVYAGSKDLTLGSRHDVVETVHHVDESGGPVDVSREPVLVRISPPLQLDAKRRPATLADADYALRPNVSLIVSGYGYTDGFVPSESLRQSSYRSELLEDCVKEMGSRFGSLYPGLACIDGRPFGATLCSGDAGGPVVRTDDHVVVGIATSRSACGSSDPEQIITLPRLRRWIRLYTGVYFKNVLKRIEKTNLMKRDFPV